MMGIPQLAGQSLPPTVIGNPAPAVLVNATMAASTWPGQEARRPPHQVDRLRAGWRLAHRRRRGR